MKWISPLVLAVGTVTADPIPWRYMARWSWGLALVGLLLLAIVIAVVVWLVVMATRRPGPSAGPPRSNALALLEERYARGEIDREDYLQRRSDLEPK